MNFSLSVFLMLLGLSGTVRADVVFMERVQLLHALKTNAPCCVIDARNEVSRKKHPLDDALPYTEDMRLNPSAAIVVIADNDANALRVAKILDAAYPGQRVYAVKGGVRAWEATLVELSRAAASGPPSGIGFIIPKNTCESGSPLQRLRSAK